MGTICGVICLQIAVFIIKYRIYIKIEAAVFFGKGLDSAVEAVDFFVVVGTA